MILIASIIVLLASYIVERTNRKELITLHNKKKIIEYYLHKISEIEKIKNNERKMDQIRTLSKKLFNDYYDLDLNTPFSELIVYFDKEKINSLKEFSEIMLEYYYKDQKIDKKLFKRITVLLKSAIKNIPIAELDIKKMKTNLKMNHKVKKSTQQIIKELKVYINNGKYKKAEKAYARLEKLHEKYQFSDSKTKAQMNKLYDQIIELYYSQEPSGKVSKPKIVKNPI